MARAPRGFRADILVLRIVAVTVVLIYQAGQNKCLEDLSALMLSSSFRIFSLHSIFWAK